MSRKTHNDGQRDGSRGSGKQPHGHTEEFFSFGKELKRIHKNNQDYWKGRKNGGR